LGDTKGIHPIKSECWYAGGGDLTGFDCMSYEFLLAPSFATRRFAIMALVYPKCPENWPLKTRVTQYKRKRTFLPGQGR